MSPQGYALQGVLALGGLCVGSFAATAAIRQARSEPFLLGRSHCDGCGVTLGYWQTVPVVSYVAGRGACRACGARIEMLHLWGEIAGAVVVITAFAVVSPPRAAILAVLGLALLAAAMIDLKTLRLPDALTLAVAVAGAALSALRDMTALWIGLGAASLTVLLLQGLRMLYRRRRGLDGLGFGDVKLAGALAIWLGFATPWAIAVGALVGLAFAAVSGGWRERFAFGPALAAGALIVGLTEEALRWPTLV